MAREAVEWLSGSRAEVDAEFTAFVAQAQKRLRRVAYLVCGDVHLADDAVQSALARVYARWRHIERSEGAYSYARRAVVHAAIAEGRRPWRREHPTEQLPDRPAAPQPDGLTTAIAEALGALPARRRAVVVLRHVEDLDVESTAALLGISAGTVKSQTLKGLATLRHLLTDPSRAETRRPR
jgi:RNA polymerase sigma-70 factor (sigma-E family)